MKRIAVKIGSNVLSRADGTLDVTRMSALVDQMAQLHQQGIEVILISSGAVASGRSELKCSRKMDSVDQRQLFSAVGQAKLLNRYYELFREYNIKVGQVLTTKENFSTRRHYLNQRNCMMVMLANKVIPIVNENDTISVTELMFTDNDELSGLIATMMDADKLILLSNIDGIYNGNPTNPKSELITEVVQGKELTQYISKEKSGFGRGGMTTKAKIAQQVAREGIEVVIANGKRDQILVELINDQTNIPHSKFVPSQKEVSSVKKWIAHSAGFAKGRVFLNEQATKALCGPTATSLLPIGVLQVEGEFEKDDIVQLIGYKGKKIGVGRINCDAIHAKDVAGKKGERALIHYDYLCLE